MNNRCQLHRGFFMLRPCEQPALQMCTNCARPVCADHLSPQAELPRCVECAAQESQETDDTSYDNDWTYSQRTRYHSTNTTHSHYDDSDYDSFSSTGEDEEQAEADDPEADFSDS